MSARLKRASRLVGLAEKALAAARARASDAQRAVATTAADSSRLEANWARASQGFAKQVECAGDLTVEAAYVRTLRLQADVAGKRAADAVAEERRCAELVVEAERDRRKLELWQERLTAAEREQDARGERRASDELAARTARGRT